MRWSRFKDKDSREIFLTMQQRVFPAIKKMKYGRLPDFDANGELVEIEDDPTRPDEGNTAFARYMDDAMFLIPTPQVLQKIITGLEDLYTHDIADLDMQGDLYEYMLDKLAIAGKNGQFRTPKHIRDMMVELVQPTPDDFICDPACGTAGFLVSSAQYLRTHYEDSMTPEQWQHFAGPMFTGFDTDRTMLRISAMNLMLHSITNPEIDYKDSVSKQNSICSKYTVCLANPPFKGTVDAESINDDLKAVTNTKKTELLFLGGEVGVCGRQDHHHALQGQPAIPAARAELPVRSGPGCVERAAQHREGGQSGGTYGAQRVGGGCSVQPAGAVRLHPVGGLLLRHGLCGALL